METPLKIVPIKMPKKLLEAINRIAEKTGMKRRLLMETIWRSFPDHSMEKF
jgi:metal-responsive CopG/Arc/MetJ family transcriptional regulator